MRWQRTNIHSFCIFALIVAGGLLPGAIAAADEGATLHLPFDGVLEPKAAHGQRSFRSYGDTTYVQGVKGRALVVGAESRCVYSADENVVLTQGSCSVWVRPIDWEPAEDKFYFFVTLRQRKSVDHRRLILYKHVEDAALTLLF